MSRSSRGKSIAWLCLATCCQLGLLPLAVAQAPRITPPGDWHFQYDLFQMTLEQSGLTISNSLDDAFRDPTGSVIVVLGNVPRRDGSPGSLYQFAQKGGALLFSNELVPIQTPVWRVQGGPVSSSESAVQYQDYGDCLRIQSLATNSPLTRGVSELILNRTGWIYRLDEKHGDWTVAARLPRSTSGESGGMPVVASFQFSQPAAGRIVLSADQSLFTNGMLWHGDNAIFVINVANFLTSGNRKRLVFSVGGEVRGSYLEELARRQAEMPPIDIPPEALPELELEQMLQVANAVLTKSEDADLFNELIANRPRRIPTPYYRRGLLFAVAAAVFLVTLYLLTRKSHRLSRPLATRVMRRGERLLVTQKLPEKELALRRGEAARQLAGQLLIDLLDNSASKSGSRVAATGTAVEVIRSVAENPTQPMSRRRLVELHRMMEQLSAG